jgi:preflagellin peptidase FlaK
MDATQHLAPFFQYPLIELGRILGGMLMLCVASYTDLRSRKVPDEVWYAGSALAIILIVGDVLLSGASLLYLIVLVPTIALLLDVLDVYEIVKERTGRDLFWPGVAAGLAAAVAMLALLPWNAGLLGLMLVPGFILLAYLFYATRLLHGGGDAKAFVVIAILHPFWPAFGPLPLAAGSGALATFASLGFAFFVLFYAALASAAGVPPLNLARNARDPGAKAGLGRKLLGYRMPLAAARKAFVWPMEVVRDGKVVFQSRPGDEELEEEFGKLEKAGRTEIWVTPKIPFMVPLLAGYLVAVVAGNVLVLLFASSNILMLLIALLGAALLALVALSAARAKG